MDWSAAPSSASGPRVATPPLTPSNIDPYTQPRTSRAGLLADAAAAMPPEPVGWNDDAESNLQALLATRGSLLPFNVIRDTIIRRHPHVVNDTTFATFINRRYQKEQTRRSRAAGLSDLARSAGVPGPADSNHNA